jgi:hypothetical protein
MIDEKEAPVQSPIKGRSSKESISQSCNLENNSDYLDSSSASSCSENLTGSRTTTGQTGQTADCQQVPNTNLKQDLPVQSHSDDVIFDGFVPGNKTQ